MGYRIAVVGASGNVGRELLNILAEREFPADDVIALASSRSLGRKVGYGLDQEIACQDLANFDMAVASIGCDLVGESDYLPVEFQTGLTRQQVIETAQFRLATDAAVQLENGGVRLITGDCAPA